MNYGYSSGSGPPSGIYQRSTSIDGSPTDANEPEAAPSYPTGGANSFTGDGQRALNTDPVYVQGPSISGPLHGTGNSITNNSGSKFNAGQDYYYDDKAPNVDGFVHDNKSGTDLGDANGEKAAPGFSGVGPKNVSRPSGGTGTGDDVSVDPLDYVGISLVGKRFKLVNPDAYYVEKDDNSDEFPMM